jgi:hypothetical protein
LLVAENAKMNAETNEVRARTDGAEAAAEAAAKIRHKSVEDENVNMRHMLQAGGCLRTGTRPTLNHFLLLLCLLLLHPPPPPPPPSPPPRVWSSVLPGGQSPPISVRVLVLNDPAAHSP